jgi:hypothetical protein
MKSSFTGRTLRHPTTRAKPNGEAVQIRTRISRIGTDCLRGNRQWTPMAAKKENREMNMDEQDGQDGTPNIEQGMSKSEVKQLKTADCQLITQKKSALICKFC